MVDAETPFSSASFRSSSFFTRGHDSRHGAADCARQLADLHIDRAPGLLRGLPLPDVVADAIVGEIGEHDAAKGFL